MRARRLQRGTLGEIHDLTVKVTDAVTTEEIELMADWKSGKIGDHALLGALDKLRPPQGGVERPG